MASETTCHNTWACHSTWVMTCHSTWACHSTRLVPSDPPASSGLNKSNHFRLEFTPISQNALLLLVSGKMCPKLT